MGPIGEQERAGTRARGARDSDIAHEGARPTLRLSSPESVLALQSAVGNRAVARLFDDARRTRPPVATPLQRREAPRPASAPRRLQRNIFGRIWGGIKGAAASAWSGIKGAGSWVWEGAKRLGGEVTAWLKTASSAVWDAITWLGEKAWEGIRAIGIRAFETLALLGSLAWDFVSFLPFRLWRVAVDGWNGISGLISWLYKGISGKATWAQAWAAFKTWGVRTLVQTLELVGVGEALQFAWGVLFHTRPLTKPEHDASVAVHGEGLIPYDQVRVDQDSFMVTLGMWINRITDPTAGKRAITTMHIIQAPETLDLEIAVHELTHVAQYGKVGAVYMPQALHAQGTTEKYDYGDLKQARTEGRHFADFNREQQAQIAEDYYLVTNSRRGDYGGTEEDLLPFIEEMRAGSF